VPSLFLFCLLLCAFRQQPWPKISRIAKLFYETGRGGANVASYRPAYDFMASVYDDSQDTLYKIDGLNIQAVMCKRRDIIPTESDFKILATGIPYFLSQNFESQDSELITFFFKDGKFQHSYKGSGLDAESEARLTEIMAAFNAKDHGLTQKEAAKKAALKEQENKDDSQKEIRNQD
jgi:hypothetical protein